MLKKQIHASAHLDDWAVKAWCLPLSVIAAAWAFWGTCLGYFATWMVPVVFFASALLYVGVIIIMGEDADDHTGNEKDVPFRVARHTVKYDWFNANPVHVLKSVHFPEQLPAESISLVPFYYGKEHLLPTE